ncbi:MAG: UvrD-helicase domain-containing protein [Gallionella sp.]|nr:UvrD-helicase domain-containing protein [Gallionella sp.]
MNSEDTFELPTVTDEDIYRASRLLDLPTTAFYGTDGSDPRQNVLKCMDSVDVAACPGSGKTTLLVAKLAILAEKWQYRTRGICVLSHTNAARHEIEKYLGNTATGRRLLGYPHYIGTIHGFVNEFLALPLLRSRGYSTTRFDTDISKRKLLKLSCGGKKLPKYLYHKIQNEELRISAVCHAHYVGDNRDIRLSAGNVNVNLKRSENETFKQIDTWKLAILKDGYAAYEDTFAYGHYTLKKYPSLAKIIRDRFPLLFIDEAQDNSKEQSAILSRIFMESDNAVIRQRFGDANQAIFDFQGAEGAATDKFPGVSKMELPNSYRFGQTIADMADPLGLEPYGLQGIGPKKALTSCTPEAQHTIFLFDENSAAKVLDAYGELLLETFSDLELCEESFSAMAVGQVHRPPAEDKGHKFPNHVGHYWSDYDPEQTKHDPVPLTFMQYVFAGHGKSELQRETHVMVEKIAEGFLRLSDFRTGKKSLARPKHQHRHILRLLETSPDILEQYQNLIVQFTVTQGTPTIKTWANHWLGIVRSIAEAIAGSPLSKEADDFMTWNDTPVTPATPTDANKIRNNIFRYSKNGREVSIHAGSIHSVKGQTHTATLVLETFWYDHNLELILPWFTKKKHGWKKADGVRQKARLKLHYVAMSRPTHLLCLAMKQSALNEEQIAAIRTRGWQLLQVRADGSTELLQTR